MKNKFNLGDKVRIKGTDTSFLVSSMSLIPYGFIKAIQYNRMALESDLEPYIDPKKTKKFYQWAYRNKPSGTWCVHQTLFDDEMLSTSRNGWKDYDGYEFKKMPNSEIELEVE